MTRIMHEKSLGFNDVYIIADKPSIVSSRDDVSIDLSRIMIAPMSSIMGSKLVEASIMNGLSVPIHRFNTIKEQYSLLQLALHTKELVHSSSKIWVCVGMNDWKQRLRQMGDIIVSNDIGVLLDVANGFSTDVQNLVKDIKYTCNSNMGFCGGNVHSTSGFAFLEEAGCNQIRCGIGGGMACSTTDKTGVGKGQFSVISEIDELSRTAALISDGGIRSPSDVAKAFGAGADYVMIGGYFASATEAECNQNIQSSKGVFYGGASAIAKTLIGLPVKNVEGKEITINTNNIKPLSELTQDIVEGLKSAISYSGYESLDAYIGRALFQIKN